MKVRTSRSKPESPFSTGSRRIREDGEAGEGNANASQPETGREPPAWQRGRQRGHSLLTLAAKNLRQTLE